MTRFQRILLTVCILSGLAALAPPHAAGQGAGDFGSGYGTKFIYRRPFRYDLDTTLLDSLIQVKAPGGAGGRTYISGIPFGSALVIVDSTDAHYVLAVPYGVATTHGSTNYSNRDNDSIRLAVSAQGLGFLLPPGLPGEALMFTGVSVRTNGSSTDLKFFGDNYVSVTTDTAIVSVNLVGKTVGPNRVYTLSVYKHASSTYTGVTPPLAGGTLVASVTINPALFPSFNTSTTVHLTLAYRRTY